MKPTTEEIQQTRTLALKVALSTARSALAELPPDNPYVIGRVKEAMTAARAFLAAAARPRRKAK